MKWDDVTLIILAAFGCITLLLTQISEVLAKLPQIIRAWRQVRHELSGGSAPGSRGYPAETAHSTTTTIEPSDRGRVSEEAETGRGED
ncbi:hypothetical protein SUDANB58_01523 [Streptomyces sp. enrichment culture]|uniref:hypothetical protein n=1 Tax=Streptomyces sp. enrichment culture TaxID=1795815 RepID=UPI003F57953C